MQVPVGKFVVCVGGDLPPGVSLQEGVGASLNRVDQTGVSGKAVPLALLVA